jgi:tRNA pseudouridine55 synthase
MMAELSITTQAANDGLMLLVDKPLDWTSFDVVKKIRMLFRLRKVGHAGTLDPKATGLLIVCTGKKTKEIDQFVGLVKEYTGAFLLGAQTDSYDRETEIRITSDYSLITEEQVRKAANIFLGAQLQKPPMYSAAKYGGKPLYKYARHGLTVERQAKEIHIHTFDILECNFPEILFSMSCSKGTYVRSIINDLGEHLGCGAMLSSLRRTKIGMYDVHQALSIEQLIALRDADSSVVENSYATGAAA